MSNTTDLERDLVTRWIEPARPRPGDPEAHIVGTGIPVWALIGHWLGTGRDPARTASDYELTPETVKAALAYYRLHREVIDARLAANYAV
jgi:uncharacterized protein (DUF433 family)